MDCGSFDKKVIPVVEANSEFFYIRAMRCDRLYNMIQDIDNWKSVNMVLKNARLHLLTINHGAGIKLTGML